MKVLVTGAAGFIGSHLVERLCGRGDSVIGFDNFDPFYARARKEANLAGVPERADFHLQEGDLRSSADIARAFEIAPGAIDVVVHLAALAGIRPSVVDPERFYDVNVMGTLRLIEAAKRAGCRRLVFASSSSVYGLDSALPFQEDAACGRPLSPYASSKRAGELAAFHAHHLDRLAVTTLRFFTVYGPRQRPDLAIHKFTRLISEGQPIELHGDGSSERDYTFIDDIVDGVVAAIDRQAADPEPRHHVYNLGGSRSTSLRGLVDLLGQAIGETPRIVWKPDRPEDLPRTLADVSRAHAELGFSPRVTLAEGCGRFVAWWRAHAR